jgi:hypothetical protein
MRVSDGPITLVTFCNRGYADFTLNLYLSLNNIGLENHLAIASADDEAKAFFSNRDIDCFLYPTDYNKEFSDFGSKAFRQLMIGKLEVINSSLKAGVEILYLDSDIVVLKEPWPSSKHGISAQNDGDPNSHGRKPFCSGCMYFTPHWQSRALVNCGKYDSNIYYSGQHYLKSIGSITGK